MKLLGATSTRQWIDLLPLLTAIILTFDPLSHVSPGNSFVRLRDCVNWEHFFVGVWNKIYLILTASEDQMLNAPILLYYTRKIFFVAGDFSNSSKWFMEDLWKLLRLFINFKDVSSYMLADLIFLKFIICPSPSQNLREKKEVLCNGLA